MHFVKESRIDAPPSAVFAFHESPGALLKLTPPGVKVEILHDDGSIQVGSRVKVRVWVGPMKIDWLAELVEYDPPHGFADRQVKGPFSRWLHRHRFLDDGAGGTILRDEIDFEPPFGPMGLLMARFGLLEKMDEAFAYRHAMTKRLVESGEGRETGTA